MLCGAVRETGWTISPGAHYPLLSGAMVHVGHSSELIELVTLAAILLIVALRELNQGVFSLLSVPSHLSFTSGIQESIGNHQHCLQ